MKRSSCLTPVYRVRVFILAAELGRSHTQQFLRTARALVIAGLLA